MPLQGVRVLDLSRLMAGNMLTMQLADFGAEVIKVEAPQGDTLRDWKNDGKALWWKVYARNKKSVCLDLKSEEDRQKLLSLVPGSQVLVESFRTGALEDFGLAPETLHALNPKLVIVRISGWGQTGPYSDRPGFGTLIEAFSGFAAKNGFPDKPPALPNLGLADMVAGISGAFATLAALREAELGGGKGQIVDVSLLEPLLGILGPDAAIFRFVGTVPRRLGNRAETAAPRNAYLCKDGQWMVMSGSTQKMAERILCAIGRPELVRDERFLSNSARLANIELLDTSIGEFVQQRTLKENLDHFGAHEVTVGPIMGIDQVLQDPHIQQREVFVDYPDTELGAVPMHNVAPRLSSTPGRIRAAAPRLGEHQYLVDPGRSVKTQVEAIGDSASLSGPLPR